MNNSIDKPLNSKGNKRGLHPNSLKNLGNGRKPWHNPNGRPKKVISLTSEMKAQLAEPCPYDPTKTWLQYLVLRWLGQAVDNATYFKELIERLEGKVVQPMGGEGGKPIIIKVVYDGSD